MHRIKLILLLTVGLLVPAVVLPQPDSCQSLILNLRFDEARTQKFVISLINHNQCKQPRNALNSVHIYSLDN